MCKKSAFHIQPGNRFTETGRGTQENGSTRFQRVLSGIRPERCTGLRDCDWYCCAETGRPTAFALRPAGMPNAARWKRALPFSCALLPACFALQMPGLFTQRLRRARSARSHARAASPHFLAVPTSRCRSAARRDFFRRGIFCRAAARGGCGRKAPAHRGG